MLVGARCTVESVSFSALGDLLYAGLADGHVWVYLEEPRRGGRRRRMTGAASSA